MAGVAAVEWVEWFYKGAGGAQVGLGRPCGGVLAPTSACDAPDPRPIPPLPTQFGPFDGPTMAAWLAEGYFEDTLEVRHSGPVARALLVSSPSSQILQVR